MSLLRRVARFLIRPRGNRRWDAFLRASAALAVLAIPVLLVFPLLPTVFEPLIMEAAKYERVVPVTLVATGASMCMEYVNWHAYRWVLNWERLAEVKRGGVVRWAVTQSDRWPFAGRLPRSNPSPSLMDSRRSSSVRPPPPGRR